MSLDPYAYCQCGSGKKFKWCCQPIYGEIQHALELHNAGQHEPALRAMDEAVKKHAGNPEVWGRRAELLYANQRLEDAETSLQKAFDINPNYPYGLLLQAQFRYAEGEIRGALLLARRAVEAYHPSAMDALAVAYGMIFDIEMRRQRPIAARAAMSIVLHASPGDEELRENFSHIFGAESRLPDAARREYQIVSPNAATNPQRRAAWDKALAETAAPQLGAVAKAFGQLCDQDPNDTDALFNRALALAWLGENEQAIDVIDKLLEKTEDEALATTAGALAEVLRCGQGLEDRCDYREYRTEYEIRDFQGMSKVLQAWGQEGRMIPLNTENNNSVACILLEAQEATTIITSAAAKTVTRLAGYLFIGGNRLRLWSPLEEPLHRLKQDLRTRVGLGVTEGRDHVGPISFADVVAPSLTFPLLASQDEAMKAVLDNAAQYFEHTWVNRRLKSLGDIAPADAATTFRGQKKILGLVKFLEDCAKLGTIAQYDFNQLRAALGLAAATAPAEPAAPKLDVNDVSGLAALDLGTLNEEQLDQAYQSAHRLGNTEQRVRLARALLERSRSDRFPLVNGLVQTLLQDGKADEALDFVNDGERSDCEHNGGQRRNDYELRRAQIHVKRRDADAAHDIFSKLIARIPDNMQVRGSAIEGMLSLKQGPRAVQFAEEGLSAARAQKDRDAEGHFSELLEAAKRL